MIEELDALALDYVPQAIFLKYITHMYYRDFERAVEYLHRYFDHVTETMVTVQLPVPPEDKHNDDGVRVVAQPSAHYAIFNLALLNFHFGHVEQALAMIHETVRIAQQHCDHECLMYALQLLCRVASARGDWQYAGQLLRRCTIIQKQADDAEKERLKVKTMRLAPQAAYERELELSRAPNHVPEVDGRSWLSLARHQLQFNPSPGHSDPLSVRDSLEESVKKNTKWVLDRLISSHSVLRSGSWQLFGNTVLATLYSEIKLRQTGTTSPEDTALALCNMATSPAVNNQDSDNILYYAKEVFPHLAHMGFPEKEAFTKFQRAVTEGDLGAAKLLGNTIFSLTPAWSEEFQYQIDAVLAAAILRFEDGKLQASFNDVTVFFFSFFSSSFSSLLVHHFCFLGVSSCMLFSTAPLALLSIVKAPCAMASCISQHCSFSNSHISPLSHHVSPTAHDPGLRSAR